MKNGRSIITATNREGVCQFSINHKEFSIYTAENESKDFTFSVELDLEAEESQPFQTNHPMEVVSLQEIIIKNRAYANFPVLDYDSFWRKKPRSRRAYIEWQGNTYFAKHGGILTPAGWIYAEAEGERKSIFRAVPQFYFQNFPLPQTYLSILHDQQPLNLRISDL